MNSQRPAPVDTKTLYSVIGAIADGPDLGRVLGAVVDLLVDATGCHACFIYLRERDRLRIRAASPVFAHVVDRVGLHISEGLTGWVARNRKPAFIREAALDDPRVKYIAELEEERFQSMAAVPLVSRHGDVIGVVVLHTEAPREFGQDILDLLVHVASLVAGAIDNARLYDQTQHQVAVLSALNTLSQQLASLTSREELYTAGCEGIRELLSADSCSLAIFDSHGGTTEVASSPEDLDDAVQPLAQAPMGQRVSVDLLEGRRPFGVMRVARGLSFTVEDSRLLQTATNQLALALRTAERIERLASDNAVRQVFDALERGNSAVTIACAAAIGWNPARAYVAALAGPIGATPPMWREHVGVELQRQLHAISPAALIDLDSDRVRALIPIANVRQSTTESVAGLRGAFATVGCELNVGFGLSRPRSDFSDGPTMLVEAADAARVTTALSPAGGAHAHGELGVYRFLVGLIGSEPPDPIHACALAKLAEYDQRRRSALINTLDAYLEARGAARVAAEALVIHTNTLRQRIERIQELTELRLDEEDLLSLHLSLKLHRLHRSSDRG